MKLKLLLFSSLVFVFVISSCTMEKRLYRPGYYVSHKKSQAEPVKQERNTGKQEAPSEKTAIASSDIEKLEPGSPAGITEQNKPTAENPGAAMPSFSGESRKTIGSSSSHKKAESIVLKEKVVKTGSSIQQKNRTASASGRDGGGNKAMRGLMLILVALLLLGLGAIFGFVIGGTGGLLMFWLFGLAATIMIIVGFIMIIIGLVSA